MFDGKQNKQDIFANYLLWSGETEPPIHFHRWSYLTSLSAIIGRKAYFPHGRFRVYPTLYTMLLGEPSSRKSTAIKMAKKLLETTSYDTFAADKTRKEKFLMDLAGMEGEEEDSYGQNKTNKAKIYDATTEENLWGSSTDLSEPRQVFIVADEFNDFASEGDMDFFTTLGNLWDFDRPDGSYNHRLKNSKSVSIYQPTVSLLGGTTPDLFARTFPPAAIGSGFLARLLLIHGERSGRKLTLPPEPDKFLTAGLSAYLQKLISMTPGKLELTPAAFTMMDAIYQNEEEFFIQDIRFKTYNQRRFTQLMKIACILTCAKFQTEITDEDMLQAHTILCHAEALMPRALGEFGKNKNSDTNQKILGIVESATKPVTTREFWGKLRTDIPAQKDLIDMLQGLVAAEKLQLVTGGGVSGFLPKKVPRKEPRFVDWSFLTQEERDML